MRTALCFCLAVALYSSGASQTQTVAPSDEPSVLSLSTQAADKIRSGELIEGAAALKKATELHKGNVLRHYRPPFKIDRGDAEWGRTQVEQLLIDRPQLGEIVKKDDTLWQFLCDGFGGAFASSRVAWDPTPPRRAMASHDPPRRKSLGKIRVALQHINAEGEEPTELSAEEILAATCFELHNMALSELHLVLHLMAKNGQISQELYVQETFLAELLALEENRAFYANVVLPCFHEKGVNSNPTYWFVEGWWFTDKQARHGAIQNKDKYPWVPYAANYEFLSTGTPVVNGEPKAEPLLGLSAQGQDLIDAGTTPTVLGFRPPLITAVEDLDDHVGSLVVINGKVSDSEVPQILGVRVDASLEQRGLLGLAIGILIKHEDPAPEDTNFSREGGLRSGADTSPSVSRGEKSPPRYTLYEDPWGTIAVTASCVNDFLNDDATARDSNEENPFFNRDKLPGKPQIDVARSLEDVSKSGSFEIEKQSDESATTYAMPGLGMQVPLLTSNEDLDAYVGHVIAIRGSIPNSKIARIIGVEVSGGQKLSDAYAVGMLAKFTVTEEEWAEIEKNRGHGKPSWGAGSFGPGTTYTLYSSLQGQVAPAREWPVPPEKSTQEDRQDDR